jgi:MoxR-like ATPase
MFSPQALTELRAQHEPLLADLHTIECELKERFAELDEAIDAMILAVASGESLLLIGPPGTAKSRLLRALGEVLNLLDLAHPDEPHRGYFEHLLTPFTEPGELFGFYDVGKATRGEGLVREEGDWMQDAQVVYLDEVFNGSSAILNSLLAFMNERIFHDRGKREPVPLRCLFSATNHVPETPELRAIFDRFLLRCWVSNLEVQNRWEDAVGRLGELLRRGWSETYGRGKRPAEAKFPHLLDQAEALRRDIRLRSAIERRNASLRPDPASPLYQALVRIVAIVREEGLSEMSNRRLVKLLHVMLIHSLYEAARPGRPVEAPTIGKPQLALIGRFFLDRTDEEIIRKLDRVVRELEAVR